MSEYADLLREQFAAVKLRTKWWGITKAVDDYTRRQMASAVGADADEVHAKKYLVNTRHEAYKACTAVRSQAKTFVKDSTLPFPEDGLRLIKRDQLADFNNRMIGFTSALDQAVAGLQAAYWEIRQERKTALAGMFREGDYPITLEDQFSIWVEYPSIEPPEYLKTTNTRLWEQERQRAVSRFEQAVKMAESAMLEEVKGLVDKLVDRLSYDETGNAKRFVIRPDGSCPVVDNLKEFFQRFKTMSLGSNQDLEFLCQSAELLLSGARPETLRSNQDFRDTMRSGMQAVASRLDDLMTDRPKRAISFDD